MTIYQGVRQPEGFPELPSNWSSEWETFPSSDGSLQLFSVCHHQEPWTGHRALVVFHGMGEHGGRYLHLPHYFRDTVDAVYCLDHRGHGRSEGLRGHTEAFDLLVDDAAHAIARFHDQLIKRFGKAEIHLLGHSLGGHIALRVAFLKPGLPLKSVSVTAPFLGIKAKVPMAKKLGAHALSKFWGSLQLNTELDAKTLSRDPAVIEAYEKDRLVHSKMTPQFFVSLNQAMRDTLSRDSGLNYPLFVGVPLQDQLTDQEVVQEFFRKLKVRDKRMKTYPGFFHEPLNEPEKEVVINDIKEWIREHRGDS